MAGFARQGLNCYFGPTRLAGWGSAFKYDSVSIMTNVRTFLMMGRPGAGKGTQAKLLAKKLGGEIYSSGNRLREMGRGEGFVAQKVKATIDRGELLPAWFSSHLFVDVLLGLSPTDDIVFEGSCRTEPEARAFDETALWLERPYRVIFLNISDAEVEKRLTLRKGLEGRMDDASDKIDYRIKEYEEKTVPAVEFFKQRGTILEINGEQTPEAVHENILRVLQIS